MLEWLIVGGGIHGTYLANLLTHQPHLAPEQIGIIDPHARLLAVWYRMTAQCSMRFLRSPATHHIDLPILSLYRFAKTPAGKPLAEFIPPYNRPSLALFRAHSERVIEENSLARRHIQARALTVRRSGDPLVVETTAGPIETRRLLLAIGMGEQLCWPPWAQALRKAGGPVVHVFEPAFREETAGRANSTIVVGGGITAVQTALSLAARSDTSVTLVARRPLQESQFDFNPCGYPIVNDDLQWGPNIFVTGPLVELQVGPCARNIVGARNAGRMLLASLSSA